MGKGNMFKQKKKKVSEERAKQSTSTPNDYTFSVSYLMDPSETENRTAIQPSNPTAGHTHRGNQN